MSETSIPSSKGVRDRLRTYGTKGETYDTILTRLMNSYDEKKNTDETEDKYFDGEEFKEEWDRVMAREERHEKRLEEKESGK